MHVCTAITDLKPAQVGIQGPRYAFGNRSSPDLHLSMLEGWEALPLSTSFDFIGTYADVILQTSSSHVCRAGWANIPVTDPHGFRAKT